MDKKYWEPCDNGTNFNIVKLLKNETWVWDSSGFIQLVHSYQISDSNRPGHWVSSWPSGRGHEMSWFVGLPMGWWYIQLTKGSFFEVSHQPIVVLNSLGCIHLLVIWRGLTDVIKRYVKLVLTKLKYRRVCLNIRKQFCWEGDWGLTQVAQGGCEVFVLGDTQKLSGHNSGKPAVGGPAWAEGWMRWPPEVSSKLSLSVILYPESQWTPLKARNHPKLSINSTAGI